MLNAPPSAAADLAAAVRPGPAAGPCPPSVHALEEGTETSADRSDRCRDPDEVRPSALQRRAHGPRCEALWHVADALACTDGERWYKRVDRLLDCCRWPQVLTTPTGQMGLSLGRCRDRLCPTCSAIRSRDLEGRISNALREMDSPRLITLTVRSTGEPLATLLAHLRESFRRLRQQDIWKRRVKGGIYAIETTYNEETGIWHPHIHILADGAYVAQAVLSAAWLGATGDSPVVDIRAIRGRKAAARYVAKYASKGVAAAAWPAEAVAEYAAAMHGARLVHAFGSLHGVCLSPDQPEPIRHEDRRVIHLSTIVRTAHRAGVRGRRLLAHLHSLGGLWARLIPREYDVGRAVPAAARDTRAERVGRLAHALAARVALDPDTPLERRPPPSSRWIPDPQRSLEFAQEAWVQLRPRAGPSLRG